MGRGYVSIEPWPAYDEAKTVTYTCGQGVCDIIDIVSGQYLAKGAEGTCTITVPADGAVLTAEVPAGKTIKDNTILYEKSY